MRGRGRGGTRNLSPPLFLHHLSTNVLELLQQSCGAAHARPCAKPSCAVGNCPSGPPIGFVLKPPPIAHVGMQGATWTSTSHKWTVKNCTSFRFLRGGVQPRTPTGPKFQGHRSDSRQTTTTTHSVWDERHEATSRKAVHCPHPVPWWENRKVPAFQWRRHKAAKRWAHGRILKAGRPRSQRSRSLNKGNSSCFAKTKRHTKFALCLERGAAFNRVHVLVKPAQRCASPPHLDIADCTEVLNGGGSGASDWAATPRCSAFCPPVTNALQLSMRRTRRECGKI